MLSRDVKLTGLFSSPIESPNQVSSSPPSLPPQVSDRFKLDWGTYLTTSEDVIYAVIDGRGSGYRGDDLLFEIYYKLGQPEVQDQIDVTKQLINLYSFIDKQRVAIWGWSYGGESAAGTESRLFERP